MPRSQEQTERPAWTTRARWRVEFFLFRLLACIVNALPLRQSVRVAELLALLVHRLVPKTLNRYHVAREGLRTAFGDGLSERQIDRTIYRMWVHLIRLIVEVIQLPRKMTLANVHEVPLFRGCDREKLVKALSSGRPVIMLTGHYGNWEMGNFSMGVFGFPLCVVGRDLDNPLLNRWFRKFRQAGGHRAVSKDGGSQEMVAQVERRGHLALLGDQAAGSRGVFVPFFGKEASCFKSIALLALQCRAVICVVYVRRLPDDFDNNRWAQFECGCEDVIDPDEITAADPVREITTRYTEGLERAIRLAPEQYFWVHRRWKSVPRKRRRAAKKAA